MPDRDPVALPGQLQQQEATPAAYCFYDVLRMANLLNM